MKSKETNKETFARFYRTEISRANCKRKYIQRKEIYFYKIKDMYIFGWRNIHIKKIE